MFKNICAWTCAYTCLEYQWETCIDRTRVTAIFKELTAISCTFLLKIQTNTTAAADSAELTGGGSQVCFIGIQWHLVVWTRYCSLCSGARTGTESQPTCRNWTSCDRDMAAQEEFFTGKMFHFTARNHRARALLCVCVCVAEMKCRRLCWSSAEVQSEWIRFSSKPNCLCSGWHWYCFWLLTHRPAISVLYAMNGTV